ncbi:ABC transporter substrate-binding protein [Burkholderia multivorans]|uniref:ABC transporter substrate-binding protein n=1 Tax=Burkholderia multivorans TaxID=87883 RepID=UPI00209C78B2|nr:ABC transporter substrate-binding protein [Burkholderia multivorans]MCO8591160.1 ABC transporter substrate-binding protein [Burkholderia multivorans]MCO8632894.1 ABC transporter substrate-binding protein [Burkholderia multivorans]
MRSQQLRVKVFPGAQNLPISIALEEGFFAKEGLQVELLFTKTSEELRCGLADGDFHLAHTAVDNAVAMYEKAGHEVLVLAGGDSGFNELFVQPSIGCAADLRGKTVIVDAPDTAYALQMKAALAREGLAPGTDYSVHPIGATFKRLDALRQNPDFSASILNPPFSIIARQEGYRSLGRLVDILGSYQATALFGMRSWVERNQEIVKRYLVGYLKGLRRVFDPASAERNLSLLQRQLQLDIDVARGTLAALADGRSGLTRDARLDPAGVATVLELRRTFEPSDARTFSQAQIDEALLSAAIASLV